MTTDALARSMEAALAANPDDLATHMAYADHLAEQGDPRGSLIQVQLKLEGPALPAAERERLRAEEAALIEGHKEEWLGPLADQFLRTHEQLAGREEFGLRRWYSGSEHFKFRMERGWVTSLTIGRLNAEVARALWEMPRLALLRELAIDEAYDEGAIDLSSLSEQPWLGQLRKFRFGPRDNCHTRGETIHLALEKMRRLEELRLYAHGVDTRTVFALPWPDLRVLHVYHIDDYPLDVLARNPTLGNLLELSLWPHGLEPGDEQAYIQPGPFRAMCFSPHLKSLTTLQVYLSDIGDDGCRALAESGTLKRLRTLDLNNGCVTDGGARVLAASPDVGRLELLRLSGNMLTDEGIEALVEAGAKLTADQQHDPDTMDEHEYLWEGDAE